MSLSSGDRVSITPVSVFKSSYLTTGDRVRVNDTVKRPCQRLQIGDRAMSDPIGIMKTECGGLCNGTPNLFVQQSGPTVGLRVSSTGKITFCNYGGASTAINCPTGSIHRQGIISKTGSSMVAQIESDFITTYSHNWAYTLVSAVAGFKSPFLDAEQYIIMWYVGETITEITGSFFGGSGGNSYELSSYVRPYLLCTDDEPYLYTLAYSTSVLIRKFYFLESENNGLKPIYASSGTTTSISAPTALCTDGTYLYIHNGTDLITISCDTLSEVSRFEYVMNVGGLACDSRFFYITDKTNNRVIVMHKTTHYIYDTFSSWPNGAWGDGGFTSPGQIAKYTPL